MNTINSVIENWLSAAAELGFEFVSPFVLKTASEEFQCFGLVPQFGSQNGMVVVLDHNSYLAKVAQENGYGYSCLYSGAGFELYQAQDYIDVLNDWGWHSSVESPPKWYTGQSWT